MLRHILIALISILFLAISVKISVMIGEAFVKTRRQIDHILEVEEGYELNLREVKAITCNFLRENKIIMLKSNKNRIKIKLNFNKIYKLRNSRVISLKANP